MAVPGPAGGTEKRTRLLGVERLYLFLPDLGKIHERGRVAGDEVPPDRLLQRPAQHGVEVAHAGGFEPFAQFGGVKTLYVGGIELRQLHAPQGRNNMPPHLQLVVGVGAVYQATLGRVLQPARHVLAHRLVLVVEDEPVRPFRQSLSQLVAYLRSRPTVDRPPLSPRRRLHRIAGHPQIPLWVPGDRSLPVASLSCHRTPPSTISTDEQRCQHTSRTILSV